MLCIIGEGQHKDVQELVEHVVKQSNEECRTVLIDLSIATRSYEKVTGFADTVDYTHGDISTFYPNKALMPLEEHDLASLGLNMTALAIY